MMSHCAICKGEIVGDENGVCSACQSIFNEAIVGYEGYYPAYVGAWLCLKLRCLDGVTRFLEFDMCGMKLKPAEGAEQ